MKRVLAVLAAVVVLATALTGVLVWRLSSDHGPELPEVSAFTRGELARVGPYFFCNVRDLDDCREPGSEGVLPVNERDPVQLSVPAVIADAPWRLLRVYENPDDSTVSVFRPKSTLAVTIPTVDPQRGRLTGIAVQLMTLVQDQNQEQFPLPHAEWSVRMDWNWKRD